METGKMEQAHRKELDDAIEQAVKGLPTHTQLEQVMSGCVCSFTYVLFYFIGRNSLGGHER